MESRTLVPLPSIAGIVVVLGLSACAPPKPLAPVTYSPKPPQSYSQAPQQGAQPSAPSVSAPRRKPAPPPAAAAGKARTATVPARVERNMLADRTISKITPSAQSRPPGGSSRPVAALKPGPGKLAKTPVYYVARGDTVYGIARRFGLPIRSLLDANGIEPPYVLKIGQKLVLPLPRSYTVQKGDTVYGISRRHRVDITEFVRLNGINPPFTIALGQKVLIPPGTKVGAPANGAPRPQPRASTLPPKVAGLAALPARRTQPPVAASPSPVVIPKPPPRQDAKFLWPVKGKVISSFGPKGGGLHNDGINISAPRGSIVRAAESGVVAYAGNELKGFGNLVLLKHAGGWTTAYAHNDTIAVRRGQTVRRGQQIARVGSSGNVAQPQLHFELRKGSRAVNPWRLLASQDAAR